MKKFKVEIKWAVIFTITYLIWMLLERLVGLHDVYVGKQPLYNSLFGIVATLIYFFMLAEKKKHFFNGKINWSQGFVSGIILTLFITLLTPLTQYITSMLITPDHFKNMIAYVVEHNKMTQEDAEIRFNLKTYLFQNTFDALSRGVVVSAIVAYFIKTKNHA